MEFSYVLPLTVEQVCKVQVYEINGLHQIHDKSGDTTPNNSNICNISSPKRFISVINHRVYGTKLYLYHHGLTSRGICNVYTTYGDIDLRRVR